MKKIITYIILWSVVAVGYAQQKQVDLSKQLGVGEAIPRLDPQQVLFYKQNKIMLSDYEDKVVILDFFDTYCVSCIASLPKLQKLQDEMGDQLQIVMVTWQDRETIEKFWSSNKFVLEHKIHLPVIYSDSLLREYFPHRTIPHVAWLYRNKLKAVTHADFVKASSIDELSEKGHVELPFKNDYGKLSQENNLGNNAKMGSVSLQAFQDGMPTSSFKYEQDSITGMYKTSFYNMPILGTYTSLLAKVEKPTFILRPERIVWKVKDSTLYDYFGKDGQSQVWLSEHGICYERYDTKSRELAKQAKVVVDDLNSLLGIKVYWSTRKMNALVIEGVFKEPAIPPRHGQSIEGTGVLAFMLDFSGKYPPVIDAVQSSAFFVLPDYKDRKQLDEILNTYGLKLVEKETEGKVLVVEEED